MAVTVSYSLNFVKTFDFAHVAFNSAPDATSLAGGGFALARNSGTRTELDVFLPVGNSIDLTGPVDGLGPAIDQLSNGNIALVTYNAANASINLTLTTATGALIESGSLFNSLDRHDDVTALAGGGYWLVSDVFASSTARDVRAAVGNNEGNVVGFLNLTASISETAFNPSAAGLDNGNVAVAWKDSLNNITLGVYTPLGSVVAAPAFAGTTDGSSKPALTATAKGFALAYADIASGTGGSDIALKQFAFDGTLLLTSNASNPNLAHSSNKETQPALGRMSNEFLALSYKLTIPPVNRPDPTVNDTVAIVINPATGTPLAAKNIVGGQAVTDEVDTPTIAGFANGGIAVFHRNVTDNDIDGEHLQLQRFSTGNAAADTLIGDSLFDEMHGGGGKDHLRGQGGNDIVDGGDGEDIVDGGGGCDIMTGGRSPDVFLYKSTSDSPGAGFTCDRITDFVHLRDKINLTAIDARANTLGNNAFFFKGTQAFNSEGQIRVFQSGSNTIVEINTTGATGAEMTIQLDKIDAPALTLADFFL